MYRGEKSMLLRSILLGVCLLILFFGPITLRYYLREQKKEKEVTKQDLPCKTCCFYSEGYTPDGAKVSVCEAENRILYHNVKKRRPIWCDMLIEEIEGKDE